MQYYIYELIDPRNKIPFYIGKGSSKRAESHFWSSSKGENPHKDNKISKLLSLGYDRNDIINYTFFSSDESKILKIEEVLIDKNIKQLTNVIRGGIQPPKRYGKDNNFFGGISKESIEKAKKSRKKTLENKTPEQLSADNGGRSFIGIDPDGVEYEGLNQKQFADEHNLSKCHLCSCLSGKRKTHKKWRFKFK